MSAVNPLSVVTNFSTTQALTPLGRLAATPDGILWGTTFSGGTYGNGTIFQAAGNGATTLYNFPGGLGGANPYAGLTLAPDGDFYGTTYSGGASNYGMVFR